MEINNRNLFILTFKKMIEIKNKLIILKLFDKYV